MPLLGRSKSSSKRNSCQDEQPASCQSPLFGLRRQLQPATTTTTSSAGNKQQLGSEKSPTSSKVSRDELSSIPQQISREQVKYAFAMMDADRDGMIDLRDLSHMLANLGLPIDDAILAHLITSSVSKRGDHRISEVEFFDWLSQFIEITAASAATGAGSRLSRSQASRTSALREQQQQQTSSNTTKQSYGGKLIAQPDEHQANWFSRGRRGSGSGLALMRSLSGSSLGSQGDFDSSVSPTGGSGGANSNSSPNLGGSPSGGSKKRHSSKSSKKKDKESGAGASTNVASATTPGQDEQEEARNDLKAAFCVFDLDGDGYITLDEVQSGLKLIGESWTQAEIRQLFQANNSSKQLQSLIPGATRRAGSKSRNQSSSAATDLNSKSISIDEFVSLLL